MSSGEKHIYWRWELLPALRSVGVVALHSFLVAGPSIADANADAPSKEEIRIKYNALSPVWPPVPQIVQDAFVASEDRNFFARPVRSPITSRVTLIAGNGQRNATYRAAFNVLLGYALSDDEILDWYVNGVYLGLGCFGVVDAANAVIGSEIGAREPLGKCNP